MTKQQFMHIHTCPRANTRTHTHTHTHTHTRTHPPHHTPSPWPLQRLAGCARLLAAFASARKSSKTVACSGFQMGSFSRWFAALLLSLSKLNMLRASSRCTTTVCVCVFIVAIGEKIQRNKAKLKCVCVCV